ncbi:MAG: hypothetical protein J0653_02425 [Deltaproteobacteria bacterium]|nr:hypothetical protein [Deltaproteobacteria bacterium]
MDTSVSLHITPKGAEEVQHRVYKLNIKKRSILIQLVTPHTIEQILHNTVFPHKEIIEEIESLLREGFMRLGGNNEVPVQRNEAPTQKNLTLDDEIIVSEAKFLLSDFCVDSFGTQSKELAEEIRACHDVACVRSFLNKTYTLTEKFSPGQLPRLMDVVREINDTA